MTKKLTTIAVLALFLVGALSVSAQSGSTGSDAEKRARDIRKEMEEKRKEIQKEMEKKREEIKDKHTNVLQNISDQKERLSEELKRQIEGRREEYKKEIELKKERFKAAIDVRKEEVKQKREMLKEEFKTKLELIKDERKKQILTRIDDNFIKVHDRIVVALTESLGKIQGVLDRVSERASMLEQEGKNTVAVEKAISNAQKTIDAAQDAIKTQTGKTYQITIESEDRIKNNVGEVRSQMSKDLQAVRKLVYDAREAVRVAIQALLAIAPKSSAEPTVSPEASELPEPSESPSPTTS